MRVGILSTIDAPLLGHIVRELTRERIRISAVVFDAKQQTERDHRIHLERTDGRMPSIPLQEFESLHLPFYFVSNHSSGLTAELVRALSLDLLVNGGTPRILSPEILQAPAIGVINCHPGLLPRFRGCTCVEWAVYLDEQVGNTVHFMNEEIDRGPIVLQEGLVFGKADGYVDIRVKVYEHGNRLLARAVRRILAERLHPDKLSPQADGRYFKVIESDKMNVVVGKLAAGAYAFQR